MATRVLRRCSAAALRPLRPLPARVNVGASVSVGSLSLAPLTRPAVLALVPRRHAGGKPPSLTGWLKGLFGDTQKQDEKAAAQEQEQDNPRETAARTAESSPADTHAAASSPPSASSFSSSSASSASSSPEPSGSPSEASPAQAPQAAPVARPAPASPTMAVEPDSAPHPPPATAASQKVNEEEDLATAPLRIVDVDDNDDDADDSDGSDIIGLHMADVCLKKRDIGKEARCVVRQTSPRTRVAGGCTICAYADEIDYKNVRLLAQFVSPNTGRILPRRTTGVCANKQRKLSKAIKRSRQFGLMPYLSRVETKRDLPIVTRRFVETNK